MTHRAPVYLPFRGVCIRTGSAVENLYGNVTSASQNMNRLHSLPVEVERSVLVAARTPRHLIVDYDGL